jgi:PhnB protein
MVHSAARPAVSPYLCAKNAGEALEFYAAAFGAREHYRLTEPGGRIGHAEFDIGGAVLQISDEYPDFGALSPGALGGSPVSFTLLVPDCDAALARAVEAGATLLRPAREEFYGDRTGMVACPFGYRWHLSQVREVISPQEMQARFTKMLDGGEGA